jgi:hypothetical protein
MSNAEPCSRRLLVETIVKTSWRSAGGNGRAPAWVRDSFAVLLSAYATAAFAADFNRSAQDGGPAAARVLDAVPAQAVVEGSRR